MKNILKFFIKFDFNINLTLLIQKNILEILALIYMNSTKNIFKMLNVVWDYKR
jgi:hypothetical protein